MIRIYRFIVSFNIYILIAMELKRSVRLNMHWLVENIPAMPHVDFLYSHEALNEEDYQAIRAERTEAAKVSIGW